ncbi:MAG: phosphatidate cytidylyltransferase [Firmicutes bacterium]|nr:phosphatidate cytidylyltransferase [Bacillota bacterium]MBR3052728.1 phosphatidate cytidylyltransferase [Bacillota bacterium]
MKTRIIAGVCMVPLLIFVYLGGYPLMAVALAVGIIGCHELIKGFEALDIHASRPIAFALLVLLYALDFAFPDDPAAIGAWLAASVIVSLLFLFKIDGHKAEDAVVTLFSVAYVGFLSFHIVLIDQLPEHGVLIWLVLITAFGTDIFAYFSGYFLGRHKLCPALSPKKTVEGAVGGMLGSALLSVVFGLIFARKILVHCLIIGLIGSVFAQCGDLSASALKRRMGIKDYGNLIPGHGGILDRFDSVLFTAPFIYYYIRLAVLR